MKVINRNILSFTMVTGLVVAFLSADVALAGNGKIRGNGYKGKRSQPIHSKHVQRSTKTTHTRVVTHRRVAHGPRHIIRPVRAVRPIRVVQPVTVIHPTPYHRWHEPCYHSAGYDGFSWNINLNFGSGY